MTQSMCTQQVQIAMKKPRKKRIQMSDEERRRRLVIAVSNHRKNNEHYREYLKGRNKIHAQKPEYKSKKNIKARLGRNKIKLDKQLQRIWKDKGFCLC